MNNFYNLIIVAFTFIIGFDLISTKLIAVGFPKTFFKSYGTRGPAFEIKNGYCLNPRLQDRVLHEYHYKRPIPFVVRDAMSKWQGKARIYCVIAKSAQNPSVRSKVEIIEGGVNHTFVTIKMKSVKEGGFEYNIEVFAKNK